MRIIGIDQSLSKCAMVFVDTTDKDLVVDFTLSKTGNSKVKTKRKDATYYDTLEEQIHHICNDVCTFVRTYNPEYIVFESLSFASVGNATRDLASLMGAIRETLIREGITEDKIILSIAPTSLKTFARELLKPLDRVERDDKGNIVILKSKKEKKVKMDKKLMVKAVREVFGETYLATYNYSTGLDDLADATLLALKVSKEYA